MVLPKEHLTGIQANITNIKYSSKPKFHTSDRFNGSSKYINDIYQDNEFIILCEMEHII